MSDDQSRESSGEPLNVRLWNMVVAQAKSRFRVYPSPAAAHWVHQTYIQRGGRFGKAAQLDRDNRKEKKKTEEREERQKHGKNGRPGNDKSE